MSVIKEGASFLVSKNFDAADHFNAYHQDSQFNKSMLNKIKPGDIVEVIKTAKAVDGTVGALVISVAGKRFMASQFGFRWAIFTDLHVVDRNNYYDYQSFILVEK